MNSTVSGAYLVDHLSPTKHGACFAFDLFSRRYAWLPRLLPRPSTILLTRLVHGYLAIGRSTRNTPAREAYVTVSLDASEDQDMLYGFFRYVLYHSLVLSRCYRRHTLALVVSRNRHRARPSRAIHAALSTFPGYQFTFS